MRSLRRGLVLASLALVPIYSAWASEPARQALCSQSAALTGPENVVVSLVLRDPDTGVVLDQIDQVITLNPVGDPQLNPLPEPDVDGLTAILEAPGVDVTFWAWEIEDPDQGIAPCSFDGSATCRNETTRVGILPYTWESGGVFSYSVVGSNCVSPATDKALGTVQVFSGAEPVIEDFRLAPGHPCCLPFPFSTMICPAETELDFLVEMETAGSYSFLFDWDRVFNQSPEYEGQTPNSANGSVYGFSHSYPVEAPSFMIPMAHVFGGNEVEFQFGVILSIGECATEGVPFWWWWGL